MREELIKEVGMLVLVMVVCDTHKTPTYMNLCCGDERGHEGLNVHGVVYLYGERKEDTLWAFVFLTCTLIKINF